MHQAQAGIAMTLYMLSRLKGIETNPDKPDRLGELVRFVYAFPFEGN